MSGTRARRGRPGHDQAAVLAAAVDLFNRRGYDATSVGDIAQALQVTKSAVYHHVPGKEQLLADALDEALTALEAAVEAVPVVPGTAGASLREVLRRSVEVLVDHQPAVTLLLRVHGNTPTERAALDRRRAVDARLAALVQRAADEGAVRSDLSAALVSRLLFGMVNSLVEWYRADGALPRDELARAVAGLAFDGLGGRGPS